jgi:hypothetical protein
LLFFFCMARFDCWLGHAVFRAGWGCAALLGAGRMAMLPSPAR